MANKRVTNERLLSWIADFNNRQGRSPTVREIGAGVGYSSTATVHRRLIQLKTEGLLQEIVKGGHRDLRVKGRPVGREAHLEDLLAEAAEWFSTNNPTRDAPRWVLKSQGILKERTHRG